MENEIKEYREERFEFALYVNGFVICKRNFKLNNFNEQSMHSLEFKHCVDDIVTMIDENLKSNSRVYTWYNYVPEDVTDEFKENPLKPWECTFKFVVTDNGKEVISKIWDGYGYPKAVREKVDLTNKTVKVTTSDGITYTFDKDEYFSENADRLSREMYVLRAMIGDKQDILKQIIRKMREVCTSSETSFKNDGDYTLSDVYPNKEIVKDANGNEKKVLNRKTSRKYIYSKGGVLRKYIADWAKAVSEKTKEYKKSLYY